MSNILLFMSIVYLDLMTLGINAVAKGLKIISLNCALIGRMSIEEATQKMIIYVIFCLI